MAWPISFQGSIIAKGFIPLSPLTILSLLVMWESNRWLGKYIAWSTGKKELQENMNRCTHHCEMTETMLKMA